MKWSVLFEIGWSGKPLLYMNLEQTHGRGEEGSHVDIGGGGGRVSVLRGGGS